MKRVRRYTYECSACGVEVGEVPCLFTFKSRKNILEEPTLCPYGDNQPEWVRKKKKRKGFRLYKIAGKKHCKPMTGNKMRKHIWYQQPDIRTERFVDFTLDYISERTGIVFVPVEVMADKLIKKGD